MAPKAFTSLLHTTMSTLFRDVLRLLDSVTMLREPELPKLD